MSYVEKNLTLGETIVYRATLHWAIYIPPLFFTLVAVLMPLGGEELLVVSVLVFLFLVLPTGIGAFVNRKTSEFAVTNKRVVMKFGFIRRSSLEVLLTKIEGVSVDQGILGRILDYGTIVVGGTGGSRTPFPKIWPS